VKIGGIAAAMIALALFCVARVALALPSDPEEYNQAAAVAQRHRADLMKIPHVKSVDAAWNTAGEVFISVDVDDQANLSEVERKVPSQLEGFWVEIEAGGWVGVLRRGRKANRNEPSPQPTRFPTVDAHGHHHHTWLKPASPGATPASP
jgi:hypothetical protein